MLYILTWLGVYWWDPWSMEHHIWQHHGSVMGGISDRTRIRCRFEARSWRHLDVSGRDLLGGSATDLVEHIVQGQRQKQGGWRVTPIVSGSLLGRSYVFFGGLNLESVFSMLLNKILILNPFAPRSFRVVLIPPASTCFVFHLIQAGM